jgi:MFS family permease
VSVEADKPRFFLGWKVVGVALLAAFTQVAFFNPTLGILIPEFERDFGWSRTEISLGVTLGSLVGAATAPLFGPAIDRYGGRRFVVGGAALMAICLVLLSLMQGLWQFYILYALGRGTASGLLNLAAGVTVSKWFVRRWLHPRPEAFGLEPDGGAEEDEGEPRSRRTSHIAEYSWSRADALKTRAFWLVTFSLSLMALTGGAINLHQIPHMVDRGLSPESAALIITVLAVFGMVGVMAEGVLDARIGARWTMVVGLLGSAVGVTILVLVNSIAVAGLFAVVNGFFFGILVASNQVVFADYFGREAIGAIRGYAQPFQLGTNAFGPILAGAAFDLTGSYTAAFVPFTVGYIISALALVVATKPRPPVEAEATASRG